MIAFLKGNLIQKSPTSVIVDCNNIGYQVHISLNTYSKIQNLDNCLLHTHFHISENAQTLYGFADELEKNLFIQLISVSGIGPSTARMALSSLSPADIRSAISRGDVRAVQSIKGIGPKSAQRIILELRDKMAGTDTGDNIISPAQDNTTREQALSALLALGFVRNTAEKAIDNVIASEENAPEVEILIKKALKLL